MLKKLNDTLYQTRLRLLSLGQLRQETDKLLASDQVDADLLDALIAEAVRRLTEVKGSHEREKLQDLTSRLVEHKLARDLEAEERSELEALANRLVRSKNARVIAEVFNSSIGTPFILPLPYPLHEAEARDILTLILSLSVESCAELEVAGGERIAQAFQMLEEQEMSQAVAALAQSLEKEEHITVVAIGVLGHIGPMAQAAIPALIRCLESDKRSEVRQAAAWALGMMGQQAAAAIPALERASADPSLKKVARLAISCIKGEQPLAIFKEEGVKDPLNYLRNRDETRWRSRLGNVDRGGVVICMCSVPD